MKPVAAAIRQGTGLAPDAELRCEHGPMIRRAGFGKRTGRQFAGWWCAVGNRDCECVWADLSAIISPALAEWAAGIAGA